MWIPMGFDGESCIEPRCRIFRQEQDFPSSLHRSCWAAFEAHPFHKGVGLMRVFPT